MKKSKIIGKRAGMLLLAPAAMLCAAVATAGDVAYSQWLDREMTVGESGKLTFAQAGSDTVRACTTAVADLADGCNLTLSYTAGERFCSTDDVKAGDGEALASCHRLRSVEKDMVVFLLSPEKGKDAVAILVDSPSRVTDGGVLIGKF